MDRKKVLSLCISLAGLLILTACSSEGSEDHSSNETAESNEVTTGNNLIDSSNLISNKWIDTKGQEHSNDEMLRTEPIAYISSKEYTLSQNSYVSYFKDDKFIKTIRYSSENTDPFNLETVDEANNIILSFYKRWENDISLMKE